MKHCGQNVANFYSRKDWSKIYPKLNFFWVNLIYMSGGLCCLLFTFICLAGAGINTPDLCVVNGGGVGDGGDEHLIWLKSVSFN